MRAFSAEAAGPPVIGIVHIKGVLGCRGVRTCVLMLVFDMRLDIAVAYTSVLAITALGFKANLTAALAKKRAVCLTALADIDVMEAISAVLAEMLVIVGVLNTHGRHLVAIGIALTAVKAKSAKVADLDGTEGASAIGAEMLVPFGIFYTVLAALTALGVGVILTAEYAKTAIVAKLDAVLEKTFVTLLTNNAAFLAVEVLVGANIISAVAVAALVTVHKLDLPVALTEAAAVTKTAHTVLTEPAFAAKIILLVNLTFATAHTVPAVTYVTLLTRHAFKAENGIFKASTALVTVRLGKAHGICTLNTAGTAHTAAVLVPMVVVAVPAIHAVFPRCHDRSRE